MATPAFAAVVVGSLLAWAGPVQVSDAISVAQARLSAGARKTVCGDIVSVGPSPAKSDQTSIEIGTASRQETMAVLLADRDRKKVGVTLDASLAGGHLCLVGKVESSGGSVLIKLTGREQLRALSAPPASGPFAPNVSRMVGPTGTPPQVLTRVDPKYTREAIGAKLKGEVYLEILVGPDGVVSDVRVTRSLDILYGLDASAIAAARQWTFSPARRDGQPVPCVLTITMSFNVR